MARNAGITVLLLVLLLVRSGTVRSEDRAADGKKELQRIDREMREKKKELKRADRKERSILSDLDQIDREVQAGKDEVAAQQKEFRDSERALREAEQGSAELGRELAELKVLYARRLRALYKMSRSGSVTAVLASAGPGDVRRMRYLTVITARDQELIDELGKVLAAMADRQSEIAGRRQTLLERQRAIELKKAELQSRKKKKALILANVRQQKGVYEQTLHELEESSASLWAMVRRAERERKTETAQPSPTAPADSSRLSWPLQGQVLTRFGMQRHPQFKTMVFRRGIEIEAHEGDPVHAVSGGKVAFAKWYKGYGNLIIIEHSPGFYTLYGNLSRIDVKDDDRVVKGQVIGLAGDTGSLKGSKLYFELRRNGEAQDPLQWLAKR